MFNNIVGGNFPSYIYASKTSYQVPPKEKKNIE
jgi:hypothetical protein